MHPYARIVERIPRNIRYIECRDLPITGNLGAFVPGAPVRKKSDVGFARAKHVEPGFELILSTVPASASIFSG